MAHTPAKAEQLDAEDTARLAYIRRYPDKLHGLVAEAVDLHLGLVDRPGREAHGIARAMVPLLLYFLTCGELTPTIGLGRLALVAGHSYRTVQRSMRQLRPDGLGLLLLKRRGRQQVGYSSYQLHHNLIGWIHRRLVEANAKASRATRPSPTIEQSDETPTSSSQHASREQVVQAVAFGGPPVMTPPAAADVRAEALALLAAHLGRDRAPAARRWPRRR